MNWAVGGWIAAAFAFGTLLGVWWAGFRASRMLYFAEAELEECKLLRKQWALKLAEVAKRRKVQSRTRRLLVTAYQQWTPTQGPTPQWERDVEALISVGKVETP